MASGPNIILVNCDDLGWGDLACYGHPRNKTPHLDRMAREGTRFSDFYMASPVCSPSRGAMLTGCYPRRIGFGEFEGKWVLFPGQGVGLDPREQTIAGSLKEAGYATRIVGKWHCGDQPEFLPTRHGFDGYYGIPYSNDMGRQVDRTQWPPLPLMREESVVEEQPDQVSVTSRYVEDAVQFVRDHRDGPFFLYLAHMYVHLPLYVPERFERESTNGRYGAAVAAIDWAMGVLLAELERLGIDRETMVLFTSDNGSRNDYGDSNGPLRGHKGQSWEGGQRVPLIVRWPGTVPDGRVENGIASAIDLFPTIAALCGAKVTPRGPIDGVDLSDLLLGKTEESPRTEFGYFHFNSLEAVRKGPWKLHFRKREEVIQELYNLEHDPGETNNLYDAEPELVARLSLVGDRLREDLGDESTGQTGNCRAIARVEQPDTLTHFNPEHPYYMAEYDLTEAG